MSREPPLSAQLILRLQTTSGNRAVQRLLQRQAALQSADEAGRGRPAHRRPALPSSRGEARAKWWRRLPRFLRRRQKADAGS
jgi:hypothetical protein